jgi:hypothetical protein
MRQRNSYVCLGCTLFGILLIHNQAGAANGEPLSCQDISENNTPKRSPIGINSNKCIELKKRPRVPPEHFEQVTLPDPNGLEPNVYYTFERRWKKADVCNIHNIDCTRKNDCEYTDRKYETICVVCPIPEPPSSAEFYCFSEKKPHPATEQNVEVRLFTEGLVTYSRYLDNALHPTPIINYSIDETVHLALDLLLNPNGNTLAPLFGIRLDAQLALHQGERITKTAGLVSLPDLYAFVTKKNSQKTGGGEHQRGGALKVGWMRQRLVYDTVFDMPTWYGFYGGIRSFSSEVGEPASGIRLPTSTQRLGLDDLSAPGISIEGNFQNTLHVDPAHVPALAANARIDFLTPSPLHPHPSRIIEYGIFPASRMERSWSSWGLAEKRGAAYIAPRFNIGVMTKDRSAAVLVGGMGMFSISEGSIEFSDTEATERPYIESFFISVKWRPISVLVQGIFQQIEVVYHQSDTRQKMLTAERFAIIRLALRPLHLMTLGVPSSWRDALQLYFDSAFGKATPTAPLDNRPQPTQHFTIIGGLTSVVPIYPFFKKHWERSSVQIRGIIDIQLSRSDDIPLMAALAGLSLEPIR